MKLDTEKRIKVLYVEDEEKIREQVAACLKYFFEITAVENGKVGLDEFNKAKFDLVITDILMLEKTGLELIQDIRELNREVPVIITSAFIEEYEDRLETIENLTAIRKPFAMKDLIDSIKVLVS